MKLVDCLQQLRNRHVANYFIAPSTGVALALAGFTQAGLHVRMRLIKQPSVRPCLSYCLKKLHIARDSTSAVPNCGIGFDLADDKHHFARIIRPYPNFASVKVVFCNPGFDYFLAQRFSSGENSLIKFLFA
ncbi:hypothetical protein JL37_29215 [Achromobacter sp. RTa]|nr:hypothetical protein JL37_29215 [Achromobacter sp. RTa]